MFCPMAELRKKAETMVMKQVADESYRNMAQEPQWRWVCLCMRVSAWKVDTYITCDYRSSLTATKSMQ